MEKASSVLDPSVGPSFWLAFPKAFRLTAPLCAVVVPTCTGAGSPSFVSFIICRVQYHFGEFGNYSLVVKTLSTSTQTVSCDLIINEGPINSYLRM